MAPDKDDRDRAAPSDSNLGRPKGRSNTRPTFGRRSGGIRDLPRVSIPFERETLAAIDRQVLRDRTNRSAFVARAMDLLFTTEAGEELQRWADERDVTLLQQLDDVLQFLTVLDYDKIATYAEQSQRNPDQMLNYLLMLGLRVYERLARNAEEQADAIADSRNPMGLL